MRQSLNPSLRDVKENEFAVWKIGLSFNFDEGPHGW